MLQNRAPWAYFGPETTLPLASVLGAIVGLLLLFWNVVLAVVKKLYRRMRPQP